MTSSKVRAKLTNMINQNLTLALTLALALTPLTLLALTVVGF